ncbi:MAG: hypothetical protein R3E01_26310 [Pirellulaceae bacterium]
MENTKPNNAELITAPDTAAVPVPAPDDGVLVTWRALRHPRKRRLAREIARQNGNVTAACGGEDSLRRLHYMWLRNDPLYKLAVENSIMERADQIEDMLHDHALHGVEEPVYFHGEIVGTVRKFDHDLAMRLLAAARPEKYGSKASGHSKNHPEGIDVTAIVRTVLEELVAAATGESDGADSEPVALPGDERGGTD